MCVRWYSLLLEQIRRSNGRDHRAGSEGKIDYFHDDDQDRPRWVDRWTPRKHQFPDFIKRGRFSCDQLPTRPSEPIKTVEIDTISTTPARCSHKSIPTHHNTNNITTPTPLKIRTIHLHPHSASPRCLRDESRSSCVDARTPVRHQNPPNYMAATASAMARLRSQSAPRQRPLTPEREKISSAKKRLSFPVNDGGCSDGGGVRRPGSKNINVDCSGLVGRRSSMSCYTESVDDDDDDEEEVYYHLSSNDYPRRWLR